MIHLAEKQHVGKCDIRIVPIQGLDQGGVIDLRSDPGHTEDGEPPGVTDIVNVILSTPHEGDPDIGNAETGVWGFAGFHRGTSAAATKFVQLEFEHVGAEAGAQQRFGRLQCLQKNNYFVSMYSMSSNIY